ncbi:hypothetical protein ACTXM3_17795 [Glutamicibacter arilaitensis]|uniref:Uncharacterized protein n=1 Tax=Glutamicibacter arilaitensis TaxID=256701 RepID=A0A2N7S2P9_9MICC|nr:MULTISPECIES: hypothetical protein [Glutamicibacter]PMQ20436.1 hypothetical protein CIK84_02120 [Glutamicibacter arilaitensis]HCJ55812.1 hypothetical protein [Glutamicibacter sp.]HCM95598.1 hypothetical protein [Glutamicibacter sp.]
MDSRPVRDKGDEFRADELEVLALLCSGSDDESAKARQQLKYARWGGYQFDDCDCFCISFPSKRDCESIRHSGGPFSTVAVSKDGTVLGHLDLWLLDGYLRSVDYMPIEDDPGHLPTTRDYTLEFSGRN